VGDPTVVNVSHALQNPEKTKKNLLNNPVPRNCDQIIAIYDFVTERSLVCIPVLFNGAEYKQRLLLRKRKEIKVAKNYFETMNNPVNSKLTIDIVPSSISRSLIQFIYFTLAEKSIIFISEMWKNDFTTNYTDRHSDLVLNKVTQPAKMDSPIALALPFPTRQGTIMA